jgi:hypothetical protein
VDANGYVIADEAITTNKLASNAITPAKLSRSGTLGQVLTSNGSSVDPSYQDKVNVVWELISSATASASTSVEFTSGFTNDYSGFVIKMEDVVISASADVIMRFSEDSGTTWESGATSYQWGVVARISSSQDGADSEIHLNATTGQPVGTLPIRGEINLPDMANVGTLYDKYVNGFLQSYGNYVHRFGGLYLKNTAVALNGVQLLLSTGNFTSGAFYLYGIKKT